MNPARLWQLGQVNNPLEQDRRGTEKKQPSQLKLLENNPLKCLFIAEHLKPVLGSERNTILHSSWRTVAVYSTHTGNRTVLQRCIK